MRDKEGSGFFCVEGLGDGAENIHLGYGVIITKNTIMIRDFVIRGVEIRKQLL